MYLLRRRSPRQAIEICAGLWLAGRPENEIVKRNKYKLAYKTIIMYVCLINLVEQSPFTDDLENGI